ncbi:MAG: GGDEF domain-containing protein [Neglectibacter timonensis]
MGKSISSTGKSGKRYAAGKGAADSLTHIYNAEACRLLVAERLARKAENEGSALLLLDVDHFKEVNDTYGHLRGDQSLEAVARLLQANAGEGDIVGRPGGDEFIVYLTHVEDTEMLEKRCEQLCEGLRSLLVAGKIKLTASVGAVFCTGSLEYSALYELADQALYQTKRAGRDGYRISRASSSAGDLDGG